MPIKAGRVGVNPSQVDPYGNVIGSGDTYTKTQIDSKLANKVSKSRLNANDKDFYFAYDEDTDKYGYKLGVDGDFNPFSSGASTIGFNVPIDLLTTDGLSYYSNAITYVSGGYYKDNNGTVYVDITLNIGVDVPNNGDLISGLPSATSGYGGGLLGITPIGNWLFYVNGNGKCSVRQTGLPRTAQTIRVYGEYK